MLEHVSFSKNGIEVMYDSEDSHASTHFEDTPRLKALVVEALQNIVLEGESIFIEHDLGRIVGTTDLVETTDEDEIVYAKRKNRQTYARFTRSQAPQPCSKIVLFLELQPNGIYKLGSAWIGYGGPSFPGEAAATPESYDYWARHALVWGTQEIQPDTETHECPWPKV